MSDRKFFRSEIKRVADFCKNPSPEQDKIVADLVAYLCIRLYGYFETFVEGVVYPDQMPPRHSNFRPKELKTYMGNRCPQWQCALETEFRNNGEMKELLKALVIERNNIAHGKGTYLTLQVLKVHVKNICALEKLISNIIKEHPSE